MPFIVRQPETIDLEVSVKPPDGSKRSFTVTAKYLSMKERKDLLAEINDSEMQDIDVLKKLITGWSGVHEEDGDDTPFNASNLERIADIPCVYDALINAVIGEYLNPMPAMLQPYARKN